ncbi:uncharacterized protein FIBRA_04739 [Fibroporia radiculosa]|uniref:laccase n=1 Tax=Fibroporia radiculosa TaxID=599839 RepID=J4GPR2_9APHY|nr:uncharacterized protein FIBRA_04739 [Fibroporia radiculosa]CCM02635.1 predicted protein [Fibroporia radiculosa]
MKLLPILSAIALSIRQAQASIGPVTNLHIVNANIAPDGFNRSAVLADGTFPGPTIAGYKGDNFRINVQNSLTDHTMNKTTSIHWHGLFQHGTNWADGPAMVTQCPIISGDSFLYDFNVPDQAGKCLKFCIWSIIKINPNAGTFWYHSHEGLQYCDGLRGPFIVYDPFDPHADLYDVDNGNTIITLSDWYHVPAVQVPIPANPDSVLINGLGRMAGDTTSPLSVITVTQGLRYRFRLISMSCDPFFNFTIDGHDNFTIIEADGENTVPLSGIDSIQIFASQRYSFILEANQPIGNYWIRAAQETLGTPVPQSGMAILRYEGAPDAYPETDATPSQFPLFEPDLHALTDPTPPGLPTLDGVDVDLNLDVTFNTTDGRFFVNGHTFISPPIPVLLQILSGHYTAQDLLPEGSVYTLPRNKSVQLTIPGGVVGVRHPVHLHGHSFSVVKSAGTGLSGSGYNFVNPVRRDAVNIGLAGDNVTIRFDTNNPGPWFFHCHIDFHLYAGFAIVFAEDPQDTPFVDTPPLAWQELCPKYDALPPWDT